MMKKRPRERARSVQEIVLKKSVRIIILQGRVTDHRIKLTLHKLDSIMDGDLDELIDSLTAADQAAKLSNMEEE